MNTLDRTTIDAALNLFWLERAQIAPGAEALKRYITEQQAYLDEWRPDVDHGDLKL